MSSINDFLSLKKTLGAKRFVQIVWYSDQFKLMYISNPKCGCSSIKHLMATYCDNLTGSKYDIHVRTNKEISLLNDKVKEQTTFDNIHLFTTVRNPLSRVVSAYSDKMNKKCVQKEEVKNILGLTGQSDEAPVTWIDFLRSIKITPMNKLNPHWRPQHINILSADISYDSVFKVEEFDEKLPAFFKDKIGCNITELPRKNAKSKLIAGSGRAVVVSRAQKHMIKRLYVVDGFQFNYLGFWDKCILLPEYVKYKVAPSWFECTSLENRTFKRLFTHLFN